MAQLIPQECTLDDLAASVEGAHIVGSPDTVVSDVVYDSRQVSPGCLFVALPGERFDGHDYVRAVAQAGAGAVVIQANRAEDFADLSVPRIVVPNCRKALAPLACAFWDNPTRDLYLVGVTGTNGKTTTTRMIDSIARTAGDKTGMIGTLGATIAGRDLPGDRTTPEAPDLQRLFAQMRAEGVTSVCMEVASHALSMGRTDGCLFDVGVFTNLTQDHLDYHGTMEAYRDAKAKLFTDYAHAAQDAGKKFTAVVNADDEAGMYYDGVTLARKALPYSAIGNIAEAVIVTDDASVEARIDQISFVASTSIGQIPVILPFGGRFNVSNALAAIGYGIARGLSAEVIAQGLANCPPVPGRFQPVRAGQEFAVLVDYAHTPDGLENVLKSARPLTTGKLIAVFGCGGNRDRTKRPKMGKLALDLSDVAVVTSDNPRRENPEEIIDEILTGMAGQGAQIVRESDRRAAIALAVQMAQPGDTIVIAGKGHEDYQIIGDETFPFSDVDVAREEIERCLRAN